jgi:opacity protein-like surface antigen
MRNTSAIALIFSIAAIPSLSAQGFYQFGTDQGEGIPLKWKLNLNTVYDDNVGAGLQVNQKDGSLALNPNVGANVTYVTPQSTLDVYGRLGMIYYLDAPEGLDDTYSQSRFGLNYIHRFSERIRFSSTNFISYELEPDYAYGYASSRTGGETLFWETDNSLGYRWTERIGTYTGFRLRQADYDLNENDRFTGQLYNQFRYQLTPQTIATLDYRYEDVDASGFANDAQNQYLLLGAEHQFSPNITGVIRAGAQFRDLETRGSSTNPHLEFNIIARPTTGLRLRSFLRYAVEDYDTIQILKRGAALEYTEYADRGTLRFGISGDYVINPSFTLVSGLDYIPTSYRDGEFLSDGASSADVDEDVINVYLGLVYNINEFLKADISYNYSQSDSDFPIRDYDRNRISLGISAEF